MNGMRGEGSNIVRKVGNVALSLALLTGSTSMADVQRKVGVDTENSIQARATVATVFRIIQGTIENRGRRVCTQAETQSLMASTAPGYDYDEAARSYPCMTLSIKVPTSVVGVRG